MVIDSGDFYGVMIQRGDWPDCAPIAIDQSNPVYRSYSRFVIGGGPWTPAGYNDFMVRALIYPRNNQSRQVPTSSEIDITLNIEHTVSLYPSATVAGTYKVGEAKYTPMTDMPPENRNFESYEIFILPEGEETNPENWILLDSTLTSSDYTDTHWPEYENGWIRYAVISKYTYNQSEPVFSNLLLKSDKYDVLIHVRGCEGQPLVGAVVIFCNMANPSGCDTLYTDETGSGSFSDLDPGIYSLEIIYEDLQPFYLSHIGLFNDITINVTLCDCCPPPQNFHVNSQTGVATWLPPFIDYYTVYEEGFEGGVIPAGWTQEYIAQDVSWAVQTGSPSGVPDFAHGGEYNACFTGSSAKTRLITPEIDLSGELIPKLIFYHTQPQSRGQDELKIYYRTSPTAIWKPITSFFSSFPVWTKAELNLPNPTSTYQIGFLGDSPEPSGLGICLDDIKVIAGVDPTEGDGETRVLEGYNIYLNGVLLAFTAELTYTYTDLVVGEFYVAGVDAQYTTCHSLIVEFPFTYYTCDYFYQPNGFTGQVNGMDVLLVWDPGWVEFGEYEIRYDDGEPENAMAWDDAGGEVAVRISPGGYPCEVLSAYVHIFDGTWPAGTILNPMRIVIYDDDGGNGMPGTNLGQVDFTPADYNWVEIDVSDLDIVIASGDFYIAHMQLQGYPDCPPTAIDESSAGSGRSYDHEVGTGWAPGQYDLYMIRAKVYGPYYGEQILEPVMVPAGGLPTGGAVTANAPAAPVATGLVELGSGEYVFPDGRSRFTLLGYNVYKNNKLLNDDVLTSSQYLDVCSPGGIYYYNVTAVWDMGESCFLDPSYEAHVGEDLLLPTGLSAELLECDDVLLTWDIPGEVTGQWIHWDNGENYDAIGLTSGGSFMVASRWEVTDLAAYDGMYLTKIKFYPRGASTDYALKVWIGENAGTLVVDQPIDSVVLDEWNKVTLTTPVQIDATQELWFGYAIIEHPEGEYPAGCDHGPAIAGKGDMITTDGETWDPLSGYGLDYNWNLQGWVTTEAVYAPLVSLPRAKIENSGDVYPAAGMLKPVSTATFDDNSRLTLLGYNLWRNGNNVHFVPAPDTFYIDPSVAAGTWEYYVSAVYDEGESFTSEPATVVIIPRGDLKGYVRDVSTWLTVPGAVVSVSPAGLADTTDTEGFFLFTDIAAGFYEVTAIAEGYDTTVLAEIEVKNDEITFLNIPVYSVNAEIFPLPFTETWYSGLFETHSWTYTPDIGNWMIADDFGQPSPSAVFDFTPFNDFYSYSLVSPVIDATMAQEHVWLSFDVSLDDFAPGDQEELRVEIWGDTSWKLVDKFDSEESFEWEHWSYGISNLTKGRLVRLRFTATGENSYMINKWGVDNIRIYEASQSFLEGIVTELAGGDPVENAKITTDGFLAAFTDSQGYYSCDIDGSTFTVACEAAGFNTVEEEIEINGLTSWDVQLTQPVMTIDPQSLYQVYDPNTSDTLVFSQIITIYNEGNGPLEWSAGIEYFDDSGNGSVPSEDNWLSLNIIQGVVQPAGQHQVTAIFNAEGLSSEYSYLASITFSSSPDVGTIIVMVTFDILSGVTEIINKNLIQIYPNPSRNEITITSSENIRALRIMNYPGQVVCDLAGDLGTKFTINISGLSDGTYMMEFEMDDGSVVTSKIVVDR
ncbi:MAG: carboxypeptidase regulatory-like domain-containing protein [Bacteroidetes bacterium]|nr:carboxypeptidase regulatory-like domain-containing protein [Bacteroidota bacterium]